MILSKEENSSGSRKNLEWGRYYFYRVGRCGYANGENMFFLLWSLKVLMFFHLFNAPHCGMKPITTGAGRCGYAM